MTNTEYHAELANRMRAHFGFFPEDATDNEVIEFGQGTLRGKLIELKFDWERLFVWIFGGFGYDNKPKINYKVLYQTQMSKNRLLSRQNRALRGHLNNMRAERSSKNKTPSAKA